MRERIKTEIRREEGAMVLGSILDTGRGCVLVVAGADAPRERLSVRLLSAGYGVVAGGQATEVADAAIGRDVTAVVVHADAATSIEREWIAPAAFGAPIVVVVPPGGSAPSPDRLPAGARVLRVVGHETDVEAALLDFIDSV